MTQLYHDLNIDKTPHQIIRIDLQTYQYKSEILMITLGF